MSDLVLTAVKVVFLVGVWLFILVVANVIRSDLLGFGASTAGVAVPVGLAEPPKVRGWRRRRSPVVLAVVDGPEQGVEVTLVDGLLIGRAADCTLPITDDYASAHHARLLVDQRSGGWVLEDLGSTNGTFLNGERVTTPVSLGMADVVRIGRTLLRLGE